MKINIRATKFELTPAITDYIEKRISGLSKFTRKFDERDETRVEVEVARTTKHHRKGEVFYAEATAYLVGKKIRVVDYDNDLRAAVDRVKDNLKESILKYKEKIQEKN